MYKILKADRDTYITDRVINGTRVHNANVGLAGTLDLFKLYGVTTSGSSPNIELSRLLIHFDLDPLRELISAGKIDVTNSSFSCKLCLSDVYGGQPTPSNFTVSVFPLSKSFDEGLGKDVVFYGDRDACNFLTSSDDNGLWNLSGCGLGGGATQSVDYITSSSQIQDSSNLEITQLFTTGEEDLEVDVTTIVSATLSDILPDSGFRISFKDTHEIDQRTYFVKRFASKNAFNVDKHPKLVIKFDDSIQDDTTSLSLDSSGTLFLYNYSKNQLSNLLSGSSQITGSNCLTLKLATEISGGWYTLSFTGSQHKIGTNFVTGAYSASIILNSTDSTLSSKLLNSSSLTFVPIWGSLDDTVSYLTGSKLTVLPPFRTQKLLGTKRFFVSVSGLTSKIRTTDELTLRVHIFDKTASIASVRRPSNLNDLVIRDVHYRVRDCVTNAVMIPFDTVNNSTRLSSDISGMYFSLDASNLTKDRSYIIDILVLDGGIEQVYENSSCAFMVTDLQ